jgi:hypothetical protein
MGLWNGRVVRLGQRCSQRMHEQLFRVRCERGGGTRIAVLFSCVFDFVALYPFPFTPPWVLPSTDCTWALVAGRYSDVCT